MDIAVAGVSKTGNRHPVLLLQARRKTEQILKPATRHYNILVEFDKPSIAQRIREFAANAPEFFTRCGAKRFRYKLRFELRHNRRDLLEFGGHSSFLAVELDDQMRVASDQHFAAGAFVRCRHSKRISQLNRARK